MRRAVGIVVSRYNGDITQRLLDGALEELEQHGVLPEAVEVMPVPGAFELPLGAMALARSRRYACVLALGCVIRGDTPHFDFVSAEAASGVQLAALETGVPVAFGVLTCDTAEQAHARAGGVHGNKGVEAARSALEMVRVPRAAAREPLLVDAHPRRGRDQTGGGRSMEPCPGWRDAATRSAPASSGGRASPDDDQSSSSRIAGRNASTTATTRSVSPTPNGWPTAR
jgi:6,7-dimethyl-8-ribityllumazine synthase